jgi:hypothetical protein
MIGRKRIMQTVDKNLAVSTGLEMNHEIVQKGIKIMYTDIYIYIYTYAYKHITVMYLHSYMFDL